MKLVNKILVICSLFFCSLSCLVAYNNPYLEGIEICVINSEIYVDGYLDLNVQASHNRISPDFVTWTSSDESIATVSSGGRVYGIKEGEVVITATLRDKSTSKTIKIKPNLVETVTVTTPFNNMLVGETHKLTVQVLPNNATYKDVIWSSSASNIVTVDDEGNIETKSIGSAVITATAHNGVSGSVTINVCETIALESFSISETFISIKRHSTKSVKASYIPSNTSQKNITWSSDNVYVATVSANGVISAKNGGNTIITATAENGQKIMIAVTVTEVPADGVFVKDSAKLINIPVGFSKQLELDLLPFNSTDVLSDFVFSSTDESVVTVTEGGYMRAVGTGTANIGIKYKNGTVVGFALVYVTNN